jgi:hypothetical protein
MRLDDSAPSFSGFELVAAVPGQGEARGHVAVTMKTCAA